MKSMWLGMAAAIIIAILAGVIATGNENPSADKFTAHNVRP